jgi:hypothetical protein
VVDADAHGDAALFAGLDDGNEAFLDGCALGFVFFGGIVLAGRTKVEWRAEVPGILGSQGTFDIFWLAVSGWQLAVGRDRWP